ncbi:hypothetical protein WA158_000679 [Blastocystis sp. Blastoise]
MLRKVAKKLVPETSRLIEVSRTNQPSVIRPIYTLIPPTHTPDNFSILNYVSSKEKQNEYEVLVEDTKFSFIEGYIRSISPKQNLLVVSNGRYADSVARTARELGCNVDWFFSTLLSPIDPQSLANCVWHNSSITHVYINATEPFSGILNPVLTIITKLRSIRPDLNIFVDYSNTYPFNQLDFPAISADYVLFNNQFLPNTKQLSFLLSRKLNLEAMSFEKNDNPLHDSYKKQHTLTSLKGPILNELETELNSFDVKNRYPLYTALQTSLINRILYRPIAGQGNRSVWSTCFLYPNRGNGEIIKKNLNDINLPCETRLLPSNMEGISIKSKDLLAVNIQEKDMLEKVSDVLNSTFKKESALYKVPESFQDEEINNRKIRIYDFKT